jgi:hypothetical protein
VVVLRRYRALNVQAGTQFCDGGFEGEVASGRISSTSLDKYSCVALAGARPAVAVDLTFLLPADIVTERLYIAKLGRLPAVILVRVSL